MEKMEINERFKYLRMMKARYEMADKRTKAQLLDEMEVMTGLHRKHLIARMNSPGPWRQRRQRERSREYGPDVEEAIIVIGETLDWICAERLKPALPKMARHLAAWEEMEINDRLLEQLEVISISTVRRIVRRVRPEGPRLPQARRGRPPDTVAQSCVPVRVIPWREPEPGHFEVDLVHHSRSGMEGPFVCTFQFIDVLTGWSERRAILGYEFEAMWEAIQYIRHHCPLPIREVHTDNGSEFMNMPLISHFGEELVQAQLSRGIPGMKNHNRFVEQKNGSLVRAYLGHLYLYTPQHRQLLNELYEDMWLYYNFFQPVLRQIERKVVRRPDGICRIVRKQDQAQTPVERLLRAKPPLSRRVQERLQYLYDQTNPRMLHQRIHQRLDTIYQRAEQDERRRAETLGKIIN